MKKQNLRIGRVLWFLACSSAALAGLSFSSFAQDRSVNPRTLDLAELIRLAEQYSPELRASEQLQRQASQNIRIQKSAYFPTLNFLAVDSTGYPASEAAPPGFDGLVISPFREGWSAGAYTQLTVFDLTREFGVRAAKYSLHASEAETDFARLQLDVVAAGLFMDAVLNRRQREIWRGLQVEIDRLYAVIKKYVRNGQYSRVTEWLLKYQSEDAIRNQGVFDESYRQTIRRIEILIGAPAGSVSVASFDTLEASLERLSRNIPAESPWVYSPKLEAQALDVAASVQSAKNWPKILASASAGAMEDSRLLPAQNYSAWVGVTFPIFEGFRIDAQVQYAHASADRQEDLMNQAQIDLADAETKYQKQIATRQIEIDQYTKQKAFAREALKLAEYRYRTFVGDLADVRDSLYSFETAESGLNLAQVELFRAKIVQAIIRGARF